MAFAALNSTNNGKNRLPTYGGHTAGADLPDIYGIQFSRDTGIQEAGGSSG